MTANCYKHALHGGMVQGAKGANFKNVYRYCTNVSNNLRSIYKSFINGTLHFPFDYLLSSLFTLQFLSIGINIIIKSTTIELMVHTSCYLGLRLTLC